MPVWNDSMAQNEMDEKIRKILLYWYVSRAKNLAIKITNKLYESWNLKFVKMPNMIQNERRARSKRILLKYGIFGIFKNTGQKSSSASRRY